MKPFRLRIKEGCYQHAHKIWTSLNDIKFMTRSIRGKIAYQSSLMFSESVNYFHIVPQIRRGLELIVQSRIFFPVDDHH